MKRKIQYIRVIFLFASIALASCKKDKNVYAEDFAVTIAENPEDSVELGTISASTEKSFIEYTLLSETPVGALIVDKSTGKLYVKDNSKFNFEINETITAEVEASNGKRDDIAKVTITLTDVDEVAANIGDYRDGGVVIWVDPNDNSKGLVCSVADQANSSAEWGCWDIINTIPITGADGTVIGSGAQNTIDIEAECTTPGTAADVCANLTHNGFSDWFLPSKDALAAMYDNKDIINATAVANGGENFNESALYWSSSESSASDKAFDFYFATGVSEETLKLNFFSVRAVRSF